MCIRDRSYADVSVPYYSPTDKDEGQERASDIEGCSYNMENGKCIKTPMKRESISFERINNLYKMLKFSLPAVKEGTCLLYTSCKEPNSHPMNTSHTARNGKM